MQTKIQLFLFLVVIPIFTSASVFEIYKLDKRFFLREKYANKIIKESKNEDEIFAYALEVLKREHGGKIEIGTGEFFINQTLIVSDNITMSGQGRFTKLIFTGNIDKEVGVLIKDALDVEISSLLLVSREQPVNTGILVENSGSITIKDLKVVGFNEYGVVFKNATFLSKIDGCELSGNRKANIYLEKLAKKGRFGDFLPNTVSNTIIVGGGKGIETKNAIVVNIIGCSIFQTTNVAIHIHSVSNSVLISGCRTFQIEGHAVLVEDTDELNVSSNIFCWHTGSGIVIKNAAWGTISSNEFIDNGSYNPGVLNNTITYEEVGDVYEHKDGVVMQNTSGYTVSNNTIFNWGVCPKMLHGITEDDSSYNNIICQNNINFFENEAVNSKGVNTVVKDNVFRAEVPYTQLKKLKDKTAKRENEVEIIQSFDLELIKRYIEQY